MTKYFFLSRLLIFCLAGLMVYLAMGEIIVFIAKRRINVTIKNEVNAIAIGHSHVECGLSEAHFPGLQNFGKSGEALYYGCLKAKKIIESRPQVKTVFIELSANQLDQHMKDWIGDDEHFERAMKSYFFLLDNKVKREFFFSFPFQYSVSKLLAEKKLLSLLCGSKDKCNTSEMEWGGYLSRDKMISDSLQLQEFSREQTLIPYQPNLISIVDFIQFCKMKDVQVVLLRVPVHRTELNIFETSFQKLVQENFNGITFLDYRRMDLPDDCFLDREHLNAKGAELFTTKLCEDWTSQKAEIMK